jgi:Leucine-rich repeat (LRR) protein
LEGLAGLVELRKLDLSQCDLITDEGLAYLHDLERIEELSLGWCRQITDRGMSILAEQPSRSKSLRVLRLARCPVSDEGLEHIGKLSSLEELDLNGCVNITSKALGDTLAKLVHISSLDVSYCPGILRSSWQGKINNLRSLELCYSRVSDTHMSRLSNLPKLEELNLDSCPVGDWTVAHLADNNVIPNITTLDLADTDLSDIGMTKISQFKHLKKLSLFYTNISDSGLRHLSSLTNLEVLNLDSRDIGDDGLRHLRNLPLVSLDLFSGRVTDLGCAFLSKIKTLVNLELCGGGIGDLGCAHLATLSNLECLNLSQNERITNSGAAALATLTNLKALNLSNTCVTPQALKFFSGLLKLQSLALYGLRDMIDSPHLDSLQSELPSLRCLRLNSEENEDGVINHNDSDSEDGSDLAEDDDDSNLSESDIGEIVFPYHSLQSDGSSDNIDVFEDAYHDHDEIESLEDVMDNDSSGGEEISIG